VVIATLNRDEPLVAVVSYFLRREPYRDLEILVIDQSDRRRIDTTRFLASVSDSIVWVRRGYKSVTRAKNEGIAMARGGILLFCDDDAEPLPGLVAAHVRAHRQGADAVTGPVLAPGERLIGAKALTPQARERLRLGYEARFNVDFAYQPCWAPGGNFSVRRSWCAAAGGFDEGFFGPAVGEDVEFSDRLRRCGAVIRYEPAAAIVHRGYPTGGTRDESDPGRRLEAYLINAHYLWCRTGLRRRYRAQRWVQLLWGSLGGPAYRWPRVLFYFVRGFGRAIARHRGLGVTPVAGVGGGGR
jgi:GT2 family glycosyltransferase